MELKPEIVKFDFQDFNKNLHLDYRQVSQQISSILKRVYNDLDNFFIIIGSLPGCVTKNYGDIYGSSDIQFLVKRELKKEYLQENFCILALGICGLPECSECPFMEEE